MVLRKRGSFFGRGGKVIEIPESFNLQRTADAIDAYDADPSDELARAVGVAFGLDTKAINDPETCAELVRPGPPTPPLGETDVSHVRRVVRQWKERKPSEP